MKLILLGAPGAGKGTQAEIIAEKLGIPTISTGNILRAAVREGTPIGLRAKALMDEGKLVPDDIILGIVGERVRKDDCRKGYILDGVPRNVAQAEALPEHGVVPDAVLCIDVPDEVIEKRMTGRRTCSKCSATFHVTGNPPKTEGICDHCGGELTVRPDDQPETVRKRLQVYHKETEPLLDYYREKGLLKTVDGCAGLEATTAMVFEALGIE